ncbi:alpha/beta hydrolase [Nocardia sp. NPDC004722]
MASNPLPDHHAPRREEVSFDRDGHSLSAWHYPPASDHLRTEHGTPAVILGHGFGLTRDCGLAAYAERFAAAGLHAVVIDFTGFGRSGGRPREVVSVRSQLADYAATIEWTRTLPDVDASRVALWGTSYSGGLAVAAAARDGRIAAVIAQVPNLDNLATLRFLVRNTPVRRTLWLVSCIARDVWRGLRGREPFYIQAVGPADAPAAYVSDVSWGYVASIAGPTWLNRVGLRDFATVPMFRAVDYLDRLPCRVQFFGADLDDLTPVQPTLDAAERLGPRAELHRYRAGHFEIYAEPFLSPAITAQEQFLIHELAGDTIAEPTR